MPPRETERWGDPCGVLQMMDMVDGYDGDLDIDTYDTILFPL